MKTAKKTKKTSRSLPRVSSRSLLFAAVLGVALIGLLTLVFSRAATSAIVVNNDVIGTGINQWQYTGSGWRHYTDGGNKYMGDDHGSSTAGDYATLKFSGVQATYYGPRSPQAGIVAISVDGGAEKMVDLYSSVRYDNVDLYTTPLLSNGVHTMKIRLTGTKNPAATAAAAAVDRQGRHARLGLHLRARRADGPGPRDDALRP